MFLVNAVAQLVDELDEMRLEGGGQGARPRDVDLPAEHDAAGAAAHDIDRVGEKDRLAQIVRHQHAGEALFQPQRLHDAPQFLAREGVEGAERLVEHQQLRLVDQRAAEVGALLHAARELPRELFGKIGEPHRVQKLHRARLVFGAMPAETALVRLDHLHGQQDIVHGGAPRHQGRILERHADALDRPGHLVARHPHLAARGGQQPGDEFQDGRFAATRGADDGDELALVDAERGIGQGERGFLAEPVGKADALQIDEGHSYLTIILSALGGRYLLVKTLSGAGAAGRPKASATSLTDRAKRSGSTSPMPLALTKGVRMLVCSEICSRSVSSASSISGSRFLAAAMPSLLSAMTSFQPLIVAAMKPFTAFSSLAISGEMTMPLP